MLRPFRSTTHLIRLIADLFALTACFLAISSTSPQIVHAADPAWTSMPLTGDFESGLPSMLASGRGHRPRALSVLRSEMR